MKTEKVHLICRCGDSRIAVAATVDLAEFIRDAVGDGWRGIDDEPLKVVTRGFPESAAMTEIVLAGLCNRCVRPRTSLLDIIRRNNAPARFHKAG